MPSMSRYGYGKRAKQDPSYLISLLQRTINRVGSLVADVDYVAERFDEGNRTDKQVLITLDAATGSMESARLLLIETVRRISSQNRESDTPQAQPQSETRPARMRVERIRQPYTTPRTNVNPLHGDKP